MVLGLLSTLGGGCSSFDRQWKAQHLSPASTDPMVGRWEGRWRSEPSGHQGRLRCLIDPVAGKPGHYQATFQARWGGIFTFHQPAVLTVQGQEPVTRFSGDCDLGSWGVYRYDGTVQGRDFSATYTTANDHGTFAMTRLD
jgi:hypothetical protein